MLPDIIKHTLIDVCLFSLLTFDTGKLHSPSPIPHKNAQSKIKTHYVLFLNGVGMLSV